MTGERPIFGRRVQAFVDGRAAAAQDWPRDEEADWPAALGRWSVQLEAWRAGYRAERAAKKEEQFLRRLAAMLAEDRAADEEKRRTKAAPGILDTVQERTEATG